MAIPERIVVQGTPTLNCTKIKMADKADESILINGFDGMTAKMCGTSRALSKHILGLVASHCGMFYYTMEMLGTLQLIQIKATGKKRLPLQQVGKYMKRYSKPRGKIIF